MRFNASLSKDVYEDLKSMVMADNSVHNALQSRAIEWGLRQAISLAKRGDYKRFYNETPNKTKDTIIMVCVSIDELLAKEIKAVTDKAREYRSIRTKICTWAAHHAVESWKKEKSVLHFYKD